MEVKLNFVRPTVAVDSTVIITKKNGAVDLLFLQFRGDGSTQMADVVASVRLGSIAELDDLKETIAESIKKHGSAEK